MNAKGPRIETARSSDAVRSYRDVRQATMELAAPLSAEDQCIQSMPDASPTKWHLAHTTWFFETFVLEPNVRDYRLFHPKYGFLFNSYYQTVGRMHARPRRGLLSRPSAEDVRAYRAHVDEAMSTHLAAGDFDAKTLALVELGLHHEQQHQELILTDIKHALASNPLRPSYLPSRPRENPPASGPMRWVSHEGGLVDVGHHGAGFHFDNEGPRHRTYLHPFALATRPVTCGEYLEFMEDGGYGDSRLWLAAAWDLLQERQWEAPGYWYREGDEWFIHTLHGCRKLYLDEPVSHVSFYEADAFARWAGHRLPSEHEWEVIAASQSVDGNFVERGILHPRAAGAGQKLGQLFGDVWEWTHSAYSAYPGFEIPAGAVGEYNGKFMHNQKVLRGGSCVSPQSHLRPTYRNFFYGPDRWQFSGIRLAKDG